MKYLYYQECGTQAIIFAEKILVHAYEICTAHAKLLTFSALCITITVTHA